MVHRRFARRVVEVDQHVAAEDEVESTHLAHLQAVVQVEALDGYERPGTRLHPPVRALRREMPAEIVRRNVLHGALAVYAGDRHRQSLIVDGGKNLLHDDGDGVSFLPRRTAGRPDAQVATPLRLLARDDLRQASVAE